jgi:hypothetical protein
MENNKKLFELIVKMAKEGKIQCRPDYRRKELPMGAR